MGRTYTYESAGVKSTVELREDSLYHEVETQLWGPTMHQPQRKKKTPGVIYMNADTWIDAMNQASHVRYPHKKRHEKLTTDESSVVWVDSAGHYMEIRRGTQTKFAEGERRTWPSAAWWRVSLRASAPVKEKEVAAVVLPAPAPAAAKVEVAAPVKEKEVTAVIPPVPAPAPAVEAKPAFDAVKYHADYMSIKEWVLKQEGMNRNAGIIQLCQYLLDTRTAAADWLAGNSPWRYTSRALIQALGLKADHKEAKEAVDRFLEKF
jgi:hypothetical protein